MIRGVHAGGKGPDDGRTGEHALDEVGPRHLTVARRVWLWVRLFLEMVLIIVLFELVFGMYRVPSASMVPTMNPGEAFIGERIRPALHDIHRGDVVVFADDEDWLAGTSEAGGRLVKRVIGLPGDTVSSPDGSRLMVNGHEVREGDWVRKEKGMIPFSVRVPDGRLWMMGDNRPSSSDSRLHMDKDGGTISASSVQAIILFRLKPLGPIDARHGTYDVGMKQ